MICGVGHRWGLDPEFLWLWHRTAAVALTGPLTWELTYAAGAALKSQKKKKKKIPILGILRSGRKFSSVQGVPFSLGSLGLPHLCLDQHFAKALPWCIRVLQRNRTMECIDVIIDKSRFIIGSGSSTKEGWESPQSATCKLEKQELSPSPRAWESRGQWSKSWSGARGPGSRDASVWGSGKMDVPAPARTANSPLLCIFALSRPPVPEDACLNWWEWSLLSLLIQMLISSGNTLIDTPRNNVFLALWASLSPVKLKHKLTIWLSHFQYLPTKYATLNHICHLASEAVGFCCPCLGRSDTPPNHPGDKFTGSTLCSSFSWIKIFQIVTCFWPFSNNALWET